MRRQALVSGVAAVVEEVERGGADEHARVAPPARKQLAVRINDEWVDLSGWRQAHPGALAGCARA